MESVHKNFYCQSKAEGRWKCLTVCDTCKSMSPLPVIKQESETDVWDSFLLEYTKLLINKNDWEANRKLLMKSFSITRKNQ